MQFLLLIYGSESSHLPREAQMELSRALVEYGEAMHKAGVLHVNHALKPSSEAKTLERGHVHDGAAVRGDLALKAYYLIDVADMHSALEWARRSPDAKHAAIEVRPVRE